MKPKNIIVSIVLTGIILTAHAQQTLTTAGNNAAGSGGSVSYSIGQLVFNTHAGINGSVAQGVQQPYEISIITGIKNYNGITLQCTVYPNPVTDFVILKVEIFKSDNLTYQLFDVNGKMIDSKKIETAETNLQMSKLAASMYYLKVLQNDEELKTFKIIKH